VVTFSSGRPWTVSYSMTSGPNITGGGDYNRVMIVGDPRLSYSDRTFNEFFNTAAFAAPPQVVGSIAPENAPLDVAHGPGRKNFDSTFSRNFHIIEKANLQFRCEVYNIFNHPSFYQMNTSAQFNPTTGQQVNKLFGQLSNSLTPRVIQLALRLTF